MSATTWPGSRSAGTSHRGRTRSRTAAWYKARSATKAAIAAAPAPASTSSTASESSTAIQNDRSSTHQASQDPAQAARERPAGSRFLGSPASG
ncbi:MAG TPA: hypothetical protein VFQ68_36730, partial [Streptosporangiaceae bacterium]|nr:hypothetical protein [Streptosporangiaceae bacterium]